MNPETRPDCRSLPAIGLVILLLVVFSAVGCGQRGVAGPMTVAEAIEADLQGVTLLRLIADDDFAAAEKSDAAKSGTVWGTGLSLRVIGYRGDFEMQDKNGVVFGGRTDGNRWVR
jgi:hypothetical protein